MIPPSELEFGDIEGRHTDSDVEAYLASHSVADEYRAADRAGLRCFQNVRDNKFSAKMGRRN